MKHFFIAILLAALAISNPAQAQQSTSPPISANPQLQPSDPLSTLNAAFRSAYAELRSQIVGETGPVIIHLGDTMVLIKDGVRTEAPSLTPHYHELKSVAHVPLAVYVMLLPGADLQLSESQLKQLRDYRALVENARASIKGRGFNPDQQERQLRLLDRSLALIDSVTQNGSITKADLLRFTQSQREDILANAYGAAEDQIDTMDRQFKAWQQAMTTEEREHLRVAVGSVHMARVGNLPMQYFSAMLDEPYEGRFEEEEIHDNDFRLVFTESVFDEQQIQKLLGTHVLDADIGVAFFNDGLRMHRDLLADATEQIIRNKLGREPSARRQTTRPASSSATKNMSN